jgi:hypothetical protein
MMRGGRILGIPAIGERIGHQPGGQVDGVPAGAVEGDGGGEQLRGAAVDVDQREPSSSEPYNLVARAACP